MLYALTEALLSGQYRGRSEVAKRSPALGAVSRLCLCFGPRLRVALARYGRQRSHCQLIPIYILVRAANATNVPGASGAAAKRSFLLVCTGGLMPPNRGPLFLSRMALSKVRCCMRSSDTPPPPPPPPPPPSPLPRLRPLHLGSMPNRAHVGCLFRKRRAAFSHLYSYLLLVVRCLPFCLPI